MTGRDSRVEPENVKDAKPPAIDSRALMGGQREVIIQHGSEVYRLRLTSNNKLILIK
jgi:hemin uptake protein HemP